MVKRNSRIQRQAESIRRIYAEYEKKIAELQKKHREEIDRLLREFERKKIEEIQKTFLHP